MYLGSFRSLKLEEKPKRREKENFEELLHALSWLFPFVDEAEFFKEN